MKRILTVVILLLFYTRINAQSEIFPSGTFIINMGIESQTIGNGLKPYGLVYEMLKTYHVPVKWVIGDGKAKDAKDFTYAKVNYKGGTFLIPGDYITPVIKTRIAAWAKAGVVGVYTTTLLTLNVTQTFTSVPAWTLNPTNISIAKSFFTDAGIPANSYNSANAANLNGCNDIFVMPHEDPSWINHGNLYNWNRNYKGAIWAGCHSVSALENLFNPSDSNQKLNFLTTKGLIDQALHNGGSAPYNYFYNRRSYNGAPISARADDRVFQMMGKEDAAHNNGSEQIYIPGIGSAWRNTTHIGCYDSIQSNVTANANNGPAAVTLYGRGFGLNSSGYVMYQGGHNIEGTGSANVSAVRQFFNFSFMIMAEKVPGITALNVPGSVQEGTTYPVSVSAFSPVGSPLFYQWSSTCEGTFTHANSANATFTPSTVGKNSSYIITCVVSDGCSRYSFSSGIMTSMVHLPVTLISFNANLENENCKLNWVTTSEENLKGFEIYRSFDGNSFTSIGSVGSLENGGDVKEYQFTDLQITKNKQAVIYYKLKIINTDGSNEWSSIAQVRTTVQAAGIVKLFPNPATDNLSLDIGTLPESDFSVLMLDSYGRVILDLRNPALNSNNILTLDIREIENGIYFINLVYDDGNSTTNKFIKK